MSGEWKARDRKDEKNILFAKKGTFEDMLDILEEAGYVFDFSFQDKAYFALAKK